MIGSAATVVGFKYNQIIIKQCFTPRREIVNDLVQAKFDVVDIFLGQDASSL